MSFVQGPPGGVSKKSCLPTQTGILFVRVGQVTEGNSLACRAHVEAPTFTPTLNVLRDYFISLFLQSVVLKSDSIISTLGK